MQDEYLTKCVVDTSTRTFNLYSSLGETKKIECDSSEQFMNVLNVVRATLDDRSELVYATPLTKNLL